MNKSTTPTVAALADFLLARIAEDEAAAQSASVNQRVTWATTANADHPDYDEACRADRA